MYLCITSCLLRTHEIAIGEREKRTRQRERATASERASDLAQKTAALRNEEKALTAFTIHSATLPLHTYVFEEGDLRVSLPHTHSHALLLLPVASLKPLPSSLLANESAIRVTR